MNATCRFLVDAREVELARGRLGMFLDDEVVA